MKNSKLLLALIIVLSSCHVSFSQNNFSFGAKAGLNKTSPNSAGLKGTSGFHLGIYSALKINKLTLQPEILFSTQGFVGKSYSNADLYTNCSYLNIPLIVKFEVVKGLHVEAGPQIGFLLSAKSDKVVYENQSYSISRNQNTKDNINSTDNGIAFGISYDLPYHFTIGGRFIHNLSNDYKGESQLKNEVFQLSAYYSLWRRK